MALPIIVGVDGSADSLVAVDWAAAEAERRRLPLRVVYAWIWLASEARMGARRGGPERPAAPAEGDGPEAAAPLDTGGGAHRGRAESQAQRILDQALTRARQARPAAEVTGAVIPDNPGPALLAASDAATMVVVGSRGAGGLVGQALGSVSLQVAGHARCPVVVTRRAPEREVAPTGLLVGLDAFNPVRPAIEFAFAEAAIRGVPLLALHAWSGPLGYQPTLTHPLVYDMDAALLDAEAALSRLIHGWRERYPTVAVTPRVAEDSAAHAIASASADAALTVLGARRQRFTLPGLALGMVNHAVLHRAHGPVAVVPDLARAGA